MAPRFAPPSGSPPCSLLVLVAVLAGGPSGCLHSETFPAPAPAVEFESGSALITSGADTLLLRVEIAATPRQQRTGLMHRQELAPGTGMYFLFPEEQPAGSGFWMYRTRVPLSVAYLDGEGVIVEIRDMEPCSSRFSFRCRRYPAAVPYRAALEVARGLFERHGVRVGDRVRVRPDTDPGPGAPGHGGGSR